MTRLPMIGALAALPLILIGCASGATADNSQFNSGERNGGVMVQVTPAMRASLEARGLNPDEEVCKRETSPGTTIPTRICASRAAWLAQTEGAQEGLAGQQRRGLQTADPNGG